MRLTNGSAWLGLALAAIAPSAESFAIDRVSAVAMARSSIRGADLKLHAERLADDTFEGREAGSRGGRAASGYLVKELQRHRLAGAGEKGGYFQEFRAGFRNILALREGSDPQLKEEVVLLGAHFDHVGYGTSENSNGPTGYIHNGADDNASGAAALLECAEAIAQLDPAPRRTILFALWDGEEKGLLGSQHWVNEPTLPLKRVRLAMNMDMVGRLRKERLDVYGARTAPGLRRLLSLENKEELFLDFHWEMKDDSDHYTFFRRGIPSLMFHTGLHDEYHTPRDDSELLNVAGMEQVNRFAFDVVTIAADVEALPAFRPRSRQESAGARDELERALPPLPGRLGIAWERTTAGQLRITTVRADSPAEAAGLRAGDVIEHCGETVVSGDTDLQSLVLAAESPLEFLIRRGEEPAILAIKVELRGRPVRLGISWRGDDGEPSAVVVTRIAAGSPAAKAGLRVKDRIYMVAGSSFTGSDECGKLLQTAERPLSLEIERAGRMATVEIE